MSVQLNAKEFLKMMKEITSDSSRRNKITSFYVDEGRLHVALYGINRSVPCIGDCENFTLSSYDIIKKILSSMKEGVIEMTKEDDTVSIKNSQSESSLKIQPFSYEDKLEEKEKLIDKFIINRKEINDLIEKASKCCIQPKKIDEDIYDLLLGILLDGNLVCATDRKRMFYAYTKKDYGFKSLNINVKSWAYAMANLEGDSIVIKEYGRFLRLIDKTGNFADVIVNVNRDSDRMPLIWDMNDFIEKHDVIKSDKKFCIQTVTTASLLGAINTFMPIIDKKTYRGWFHNGKIGCENEITKTLMETTYEYTGDEGEDRIHINLSYIRDALMTQFKKSSTVDFIFVNPFYVREKSVTMGYSFVRNYYPLKITDGNTNLLISPYTEC